MPNGPPSPAAAPPARSPTASRRPLAAAPSGGDQPTHAAAPTRRNGQERRPLGVSRVAGKLGLVSRLDPTCLLGKDSGVEPVGWGLTTSGVPLPTALRPLPGGFLDRPACSLLPLLRRHPWGRRQPGRWWIPDRPHLADWSTTP